MSQQHNLFSRLSKGLHFSRKKFGDDIKLFDEGHRQQTGGAQMSSRATPVDNLDFFNEGITPEEGPRLSSSNKQNTNSMRKYTEEESTQDSDSSVDDDSEESNDSDDSDNESDNESYDTDDSSNSDNSRKNNNSDSNEKPKSAKAIRRKYNIRVQGNDVVVPVSSFENMNLPQSILNNIKTEMKLHEPTPIQRQAVPVLQGERHVLGIAPTGSGKTLAFLLPLLHLLRKPASQMKPRQQNGIRGIVVAPTRELAQQIHRECTRLCSGKPWRIELTVKAVAGNQSKLKRKLKSPKMDILITTPQRLVSLLKDESFKLDNVRYLILDEGDRLFEMGFIHQVDEIVAACTYQGLTKALFSATLPEGVENMARSVLHDPVRITVGTRNVATSDVSQELVFTGNEQGKKLALKQTFQKGLKPPILIFVQSIERAKDLFRELVFENINVDAIHSERTVSQRSLAVRNFRTGKVWVLICTDLMARGIDFKGVNCVINYDFPSSTISYIHRVGRAGRAGRKGRALTFFGHEDFELLRPIATIIKQSGGDVPEWMLKQKRLPSYRRKLLKVRPQIRETIATEPKRLIRDDKKRKRLEKTYAEEDKRKKRKFNDALKEQKHKKNNSIRMTAEKVVDFD